MNLQEETLKVGDLYCRIVQPKDAETKGSIVLVHGIGEHAGRHETTFNFFAMNGYRCIGFDLRGHGQSPGLRQYVEAFDEYIADLKTILDWYQSEFGSPFFLHGHSLGGAIVLAYVGAGLDQSMRGISLNAPAFKPAEGVSKVKIFFGRRLAKFFPKLKIPNAIDPSAVSRDKNVVQAMIDDPYRVDFNTAAQGVAILDELEKMPEHAARVKVPLFLTHGTADRIIQPEGTKELFERAEVKDKAIVYYEGGFHETHNDLDRDRYFEDLLRWMENRLTT